MAPPMASRPTASNRLQPRLNGVSSWGQIIMMIKTVKRAVCVCVFVTFTKWTPLEYPIGVSGVRDSYLAYNILLIFRRSIWSSVVARPTTNSWLLMWIPNWPTTTMSGRTRAVGGDSVCFGDACEPPGLVRVRVES